jgi:hypothetical protein
MPLDRTSINAYWLCDYLLGADYCEFGDRAEMDIDPIGPDLDAFDQSGKKGTLPDRDNPHVRWPD